MWIFESLVVEDKYDDSEIIDGPTYITSHQENSLAFLLQLCTSMSFSLGKQRRPLSTSPSTKINWNLHQILW